MGEGWTGLSGYKGSGKVGIVQGRGDIKGGGEEVSSDG